MRSIRTTAGNVVKNRVAPASPGRIGQEVDQLLHGDVEVFGHGVINFDFGRLLDAALIRAVLVFLDIFEILSRYYSTNSSQVWYKSNSRVRHGA